MWAVIKFDKKNFHLFKEDFHKKIGKDCIIYRPKIMIQKYKNNKLKINKNNFIKKLYEKGIVTQVHYIPIFKHPAFLQVLFVMILVFFEFFLKLQNGLVHFSYVQ